VLEEVSETGLAGDLVLRSDVVPDVEGNDRRLVVLVDDQRQPVVEGEFLEGDVDLAVSAASRGAPRKKRPTRRAATAAGKDKDLRMTIPFGGNIQIRVS
jgi:hypothetical protein